MSAAPTFKLLALISIAESKSNPRSHFDKDKLDELAESIKINGVLEPILVRTKGDEGYELVCGHRRFRAAKLAEVRVIPAMIHELNDTQVLETQLEENTKRGDLHPLEEAAGYQALLAKKHGYNVARIAERTGKSVKYIYDRIKLLELTKEAQQLFLDDRITAGHAILLARLSQKDQERAIGKPQEYGAFHSGGLFTTENRLFDPEGEDEDGGDRFKARSVRELEAWIAKNVRFERKLIEPILFPETAERVHAATETKTKVIPITHDHHVHPDAKAEGERTYGPMSWRRADGIRDSRKCEHSILGVVVVGFDRGEAFDVCIARDKCKVHFSKEIAERTRVAKHKKTGSGKQAKPAGKPSWQIEEEKRKAKAAAWEKVVPAVLEAFAEAVKKAPTKATGLLAKIILDRIYVNRGTKAANALIPLGTSAEDFVRHAALAILADKLCDSWNAHETAGKLGKAFGIDVPAIIKAATPKAEKPKKGKSVRAGVCRECGCTDDNCEQCIEATGEPCTWVEDDLCSACAPAKVPAPAKIKKRKAS